MIIIIIINYWKKGIQTIHTYYFLLLTYLLTVIILWWWWLTWTNTLIITVGIHEILSLWSLCPVACSCGMSPLDSYRPTPIKSHTQQFLVALQFLSHSTQVEQMQWLVLIAFNFYWLLHKISHSYWSILFGIWKLSYLTHHNFISKRKKIDFGDVHWSQCFKSVKHIITIVHHG